MHRHVSETEVDLFYLHGHLTLIKDFSRHEWHYKAWSPLFLVYELLRSVSNWGYARSPQVALHARKRHLKRPLSLEARFVNQVIELEGHYYGALCDLRGHGVGARRGRHFARQDTSIRSTSVVLRPLSSTRRRWLRWTASSACSPGKTS